MDILISNLLSESILDFGKWSNWKYANTLNGSFQNLLFFATLCADCLLLRLRVIRVKVWAQFEKSCVHNMYPVILGDNASCLILSDKPV